MTVFASNMVIFICVMNPWLFFRLPTKNRSLRTAVHYNGQVVQRAIHRNEHKRQIRGVSLIGRQLFPLVISSAASTQHNH